MCSTWSYCKLWVSKKAKFLPTNQILEEITIPCILEFLRNSYPLQQYFVTLSVKCRLHKSELEVGTAVARTWVSYILARFLLLPNGASESEEDSS